MSNPDIELLKLQIQREQASRDFWKWAIMYILIALNPLINLATAYLEHHAIASVATKAAAVEVKQDAIAATSDASMKSWKAYESKRPEDADAAAKAVVNAERLTENMPPLVPK